MNQHGAPSTASPHRVKRAVAAKQRRLKHGLQSRVAERLRIRTNFQLFFIPRWDYYLGCWMLLSPNYRIRESVLHFWNRPCWLLASKIHGRTLASQNRPHSQPSIRLVEPNCAFDLPSRIENMNFTGAKFSRGASFTKALRPPVSRCERRHKIGALSNRAS
jgi:hypothetical protein